MELNVIQNAKRNAFFGMINRIVALLCPFITRTVVQRILGEQYLGLGSLFSSVLSVLSLAELGFGSAVAYSMYKPVAEGDTALVNALLNFCRKAYAAVGGAVFLIGLAMIPFLPKLIAGECPADISLAALYLAYLANAVVSYFMYAYMSPLIVVYQRDDISSRTNTAATVLLAASQIFMLAEFRSYLLSALMMPVFAVANNIRIALAVKRMFPQYRCSGSIPGELLADMKKQVAGAFVSRVCQVARNSFDSICISAFLGLAMTAKYNNYYYIMSAVTGLAGVFSGSLAGGVGNHVVTRSRKDNFRELKEMDFAYMWLGGWCAICILCLSQPFMELWMGKGMMLPDSVVAMLCIYFYLLKVGDMRSIYTAANGLWWQHRWRSMAEALANIALNILLAKYWGIHGIILATMLTIFFISTIWSVWIVFRHYFGMEYMRSYYSYHAAYAAVTAVLGAMTYAACGMVPECGRAMGLLLRAAVCLILPNIFYVLIYRRLSCFGRVKSIVFRK